MDRRREHSKVPCADRREGIGCTRARFRGLGLDGILAPALRVLIRGEAQEQ
jgi:hypothetical protein